MEHWKKVNIYKRNVTEIPRPNKKYNDYLKIKSAKKNDLIKLCEKGLVSQQADAFYRSLPDGITGGTGKGVDEESDGDDYEY